MPPFSSIKRSIRRRRRKLANRKKRASNPAARKRNRRKRRLRPEHRVLPCAPSGHFVRFSLSVVSGVQLGSAHRLESLCSVLRQRIFYPLKFLVVAAAVTGGRISINSNFLPPVTAAATTLSAKHYGSIFGTAISQARNKFGRANFIHRTLIDTASAAYNPGKIVGTE